MGEVRQAEVRQAEVGENGFERVLVQSQNGLNVCESCHFFFWLAQTKGLGLFFYYFFFSR